MINPMFGHRPKPRKFDLPLRYYDPKKDQKKRDRIRFESSTSRKNRQQSKVVVLAALLFFVVWLISYL